MLRTMERASLVSVVGSHFLVFFYIPIGTWISVTHYSESISSPHLT